MQFLSAPVSLEDVSAVLKSASISHFIGEDRVILHVSHNTHRQPVTALCNVGHSDISVVCWLKDAAVDYPLELMETAALLTNNWNLESRLASAVLHSAEHNSFQVKARGCLVTAAGLSARQLVASLNAITLQSVVILEDVQKALNSIQTSFEGDVPR